MITPSEIIYWDVLPAIRKQIVLFLRDEGLKQADIAKKLQITPSAVSLYLRNKRGGEFDFSEKFLSEIKNSSKLIAEAKSNLFEELNILVKKFESTKSLCTVCKSKNDLAENCSICKN